MSATLLRTVYSLSASDLAISGMLLPLASTVEHVTLGQGEFWERVGRHRCARE
jgi:hypothetical protein